MRNLAQHFTGRGDAQRQRPDEGGLAKESTSTFSHENPALPQLEAASTRHVPAEAGRGVHAHADRAVHTQLVKKASASSFGRPEEATQWASLRVLVDSCEDATTKQVLLALLGMQQQHNEEVAQLRAQVCRLCVILSPRVVDLVV
jgi:hypothetical protein